MTKSDVQKSIFKQRVEASPLPTFWLKFYLRIEIPLVLIASLVVIGTTVYSVLGAIDRLAVPTYAIIVTSVFLFMVFAMGAMAVITFIGMRSLKLWSLKANYILLILNVVVASGGQSLDFDNGYYSLHGLAEGAIGILIYSLCNYIYFEKRRYLFGEAIEPPKIYGFEESAFTPAEYNKKMLPC